MRNIDFKKLSINGKKQSEEKDAPAVAKQWWTAKTETEMAQSISATVQLLHDNQTLRHGQAITSARLYGNMALMGLGGLSLSKSIANVPNTGRLTYNVVQACVDTITSKIAKNKPKPLFLTSGGDWAQKRKAKKLNKFVDGIFYENDFYELATQVFKDACVFGTGVLHVFERDGRVAFERVACTELYVDELEATYGDPRQMYRVKYVDRDVLKDAFPEHAAAIAGESAATPENALTRPNVADLVCVVESWHLPSGPDAEDGAHVISMGETVLFKEDWTKESFPFAFLRWSKRLFGFWGQGLAEQLQNIQLEINKILWVIQRSLHLAGTFKIFLENNSKISKEHLNNDIGTIITYTGTAPQYAVPPAVSAEFYGQLERLKNYAFEQSGISQLSAAAKKPEGLNSGKALREFNDIETDRFMVVGQAFERFTLNVAKLAVATVQTLAKGKRGYKVRVPGKKTLDFVDWKEISLHDDDFVMQAFPVSSLPSDPAGRLQTIQEMIQAGWLSPIQGRRLMDFPDLEQIEGLANAEEDYLHSILERMVDDEDPVFTPPEPYDNLALARELAAEYYARGKLFNLEENRLELLRRFMEQIDILVKKATAPAPGAGAVPQAAPEAQPTSDLIPNVPGMPVAQ